MVPSPLASATLFRLGPLAITRPVVTTWAIMAVLTLVSWLVTRRLSLHPDQRQTVLELIVTGIMAQIDEVIRKNPRQPREFESRFAPPPVRLRNSATAGRDS